jgi:SAM-dependent methyltransferase
MTRERRWSLAAGTGQLSRRFCGLDVNVVAIEPAANMRAVLRERLPAVRVLAGAAEAIPLEDGTVDAIIVGNAFHHFDLQGAFQEIRRVLRPSGALALFWAWPLQEEQLRRYPGLRGPVKVDEVVDATRASAEIATAYRSLAESARAADGFGPFERREFPVTHIVPSARLADLYATSSDVASLPARIRVDLLDRIRQLSRGLPEILRLPARSVVDLCLRP